MIVMSKACRLDPVAQVAKSKEDQAAKDLAAYQKRADEQSARLASLMSFRAEYRQRLQDAGSAGMDARRFHEFSDFIARLDSAIEQQTAVLGKLKAECEVKKQQWIAMRAKTKALDKVIARHVAQEMRTDARREQAALDDRAQHHAKGESPWDE